MSSLLRPDALFLILAAPFIGSFLGLLAHRLPSDLPWIGGRSVCPACRATLGWRDLLPLVSWIASRGRCRHCGKAIGAVYPALEIGATAVALWSLATLPGWLAWATAALGWCLLLLAVIDARHMILPNGLTLPLIPAGLCIIAVIDPDRIWGHLAGAVAGFLFIAAVALVYRRLRGHDGIGWGDAKLLAAAGAWLSWQGLPGVLLLASASGLALVLLLALIGTRELSGRQAVPFGPFLAFGFWMVWLYGPIGFG
ncbi:MAG: A24 family peptidase [Kiloniellales bacterium]|nr:A24 family peptidase [Kiloniellales bacterium]